MLEKFVKLAYIYDTQGNFKAADFVTGLLKKAASDENFDPSSFLPAVNNPM